MSRAAEEMTRSGMMSPGEMSFWDRAADDSSDESTGTGGVSCTIYEDVCDGVFDVVGEIASKWECVASDAGIAAACEAAGLGPEDPLADACAITFASVFEVACTAAIDKAKSFGKPECIAASGCSSAEPATPAKMQRTVEVVKKVSKTIYSFAERSQSPPTFVANGELPNGKKYGIFVQFFSNDTHT